MVKSKLCVSTVKQREYGSGYQSQERRFPNTTVAGVNVPVTHLSWRAKLLAVTRASRYNGQRKWWYLHFVALSIITARKCWFDTT